MIISMKEQYKLIPEVFLLLENDGKVLLSRRFHTGYEDGNYGLVAGHAEYGEPMRVALAREVKEEAGIDIDPDDLEHMVTIHRWCPDKDNPHARVGFYFTTKKWKGEIVNMEPEKCDDLSWFPKNAIPPNTIDYIKDAISCLDSHKTYIEFGWPKK